MDHIILCDVDGVLVNFEEAIRWYLTRYNITLPEWTTWDVSQCMSFEEAQWVEHAMHDPRFPHELEPYEHASNLVRELMELGTLIAVTADAQENPSWIPHRRHILKSLGFLCANVIFAQSNLKHIIGGDVMIEDNLDTLTRWAKLHPSSLGVLVARSYNGTQYTQEHRDLGIVRLSLSEVASAVSAFLGKPTNAT